MNRTYAIRLLITFSILLACFIFPLRFMQLSGLMFLLMFLGWACGWWGPVKYLATIFLAISAYFVWVLSARRSA